MKYGDKFYVIEREWRDGNDRCFYIQEVYYIADIVYFNGRKTIELCPKSIEEIKDNNGKWYGWKKEYKLDDLNKTNDVSGLYDKFFDSLEKARKHAKYALREEDLILSKRFFPNQNNQYNIFKKYDKFDKKRKQEEKE